MTNTGDYFARSSSHHNTVQVVLAPFGIVPHLDFAKALKFIRPREEEVLKQELSLIVSDDSVLFRENRLAED